MFEFAWWWLWFLAPLPVLVFLIMPKLQESGVALRVPFFARLASFDQGKLRAQSHGIIRKLLLCLIWILCVAAAARPQWVGQAVSIPASGRDLLMAVDISGSMERADMVLDNRRLQRVDVVKLVVGDFVERRENDRLGLILFGSQAYLQAPLTFDRTTVQSLLEEAQVGFAGQQTAIGDAIGLAIKRLRDRPESSRVVILLTDGANTSGEVDPKQAAELAKLADIKIYTIGIGAEEMIEQTFFGRRKINPSAELDEETLTYIAEKTGGQYFRARDPRELINIYSLLDELEPIEQEEKVFRPIRTLYFWPLGAAFVLSFALALLFGQWRLLGGGTHATRQGS